MFTRRSESWSLLNTLALRAGRLELSATLPVVLQNSTALSYLGGTLVPTGGPDHAAVRLRRPGGRVPMGRGTGGGRREAALPPADGSDSVIAGPAGYALQLGDPLLRAQLALVEGTGALRALALEGAAKAPVASVESGVGTGEWDYSAGGSALLGVPGGYAFTDVAYGWLGDLPGLELRENWSYAAGLGLPLAGGRWLLLASLTGSSPLIDGMQSPRSVGAGLGFSPRPGRSLSLSVYAGLSEASPDLAVSLGWSVTAGRLPLPGR